MTRRRLERLNEQFKREISDIVFHRLRDPRVGSPRITRVEVTNDLSLARVWYGLSPADEHAAEEAQEGLEAASAFVRRELASRLTMRKVPELRFIEDRTLEHATRIDEILKEIGIDGEEEE